MKVKINGPIFAAPDGYGQAARELALSLIENGVEVTLNNIYNREDFEQISESVLNKLQPFWNNQIDYDIVLNVLIPNAAAALIEEGKRNIVYTMWETSSAPKEWIEAVSKFDKLIVPAYNSIEAFSGAKTMREIIPIPTNVAKFDNVERDEKFKELSDYIGDSMVFYSVFQWGERKNPKALLRAYYSSFSSEDDVFLVLKSNYKNDKNDDVNVRSFVAEIRNNIKRNNNDYPKVIIITEPLEEKKILQMHKFFDVFVYPTRGEGWGIPAFDAALAGNHIITTNKSSHIDFLDTYAYFKNQTFDLIDYQLENVHSAESPIYKPDQYWASISTGKLSQKMKEAYEEWEETRKIGAYEQRQEYVEILKDRYNRKVIGKKLIGALQ